MANLNGHEAGNGGYSQEESGAATPVFYSTISRHCEAERSEAKAISVLDCFPLASLGVATFGIASSAFDLLAMTSEIHISKPHSRQEMWSNLDMSALI